MINKNSMNIAKFSFVNAMKSKGFIIYNIILLVAILIATNFSTIKDVFQKHDMFKGTIYSVKVIDEENYIYEVLEKTLNVENVDNIEQISTEIEYNKENVEKNEIVVKVLEKDGEKYLQIISRESLDGEMYTLIASALKQVRNDEIEAKYGISNEDIERYNSSVYIEKKILDTDSVVNSDYYILKTVMIMIIYSLIVFGTSTVASQIANEKTSKSAEYIFTSVSARDYLNGKVIGANLKTLANMAFMVLYLLLGLLINSILINMFDLNINQNASAETVEMANTLLGVDVTVIKYVVLSFIYILLTSTLLSYIQAGMTAKVKSINEMDNSQSITLTLIIVAYAVSLVTSEINNIFTRIIGNVPVFSMFAMPSNYINGVTGIWEVVLSLLILVLAIGIAIYVVSRKFKQDILDLGPRKEEKHDEKIEIMEEELNKVKKSNIKNFITGTALSLLLVILIQSVFGLAIAFFIPNATPNQNVIAVSMIFVLSFLIPILCLKGFLNISYTNKEKKNSKGIKKILTWTIMAIPVMYLSTYIVELVISKMEVNPTMMESALIFDKSIGGYILFFIEIAILPAIFEELLFRKVMLDGAKKYGTLFGIFFTAVMFGFIHMNIPQAVNAILIGIIFAYLTIKTGSVLPAMILHLINNGTQALLMINENNIVVSNVINYAYIAVAIIGALILLINILKNRKEFKIKNKIKTGITLKTIVSNYYMFLFILFVIVMFKVQM